MSQISFQFIYLFSKHTHRNDFIINYTVYNDDNRRYTVIIDYRQMTIDGVSLRHRSLRRVTASSILECHCVIDPSSFRFESSVAELKTFVLSRRIGSNARCNITLRP